MLLRLNISPLLSALQRNEGDKSVRTFEALVQAPSPLEELVKVRPAVEHSFERVVVRKLHRRNMVAAVKFSHHALHGFILCGGAISYRSSTTDTSTEPYLEGSLAVVAPEAGLVEDPVVGGELVDEIHRLDAGVALGGRPLEGSRHCLLLFPHDLLLRDGREQVCVPLIWFSNTSSQDVLGSVMAIWERRGAVGGGWPAAAGIAAARRSRTAREYWGWQSRTRREWERRGKGQVVVVEILRRG